MGGVTDGLSFQTKTVVVGDHVKLECSRRSEGDVVWMKTSSGNSLEVLDKNWSKTKVSYLPGILELHIADTNLHDAAFYICVRKRKGNILSLSITHLIVKEPAVPTVPPSAPECSENSVTLRCSVLQDSQNKSCPSDENMLCFSAESNYSNTNSAAENRGDAAVNDFCFSSFFKNRTSSDHLKYYCAVPKCEEKIQKNESSSHSEVTVKLWNSNKADVIRNILIAALAASQKDEDPLVYSVAAFSRRKSSKKETRSHDDDKEETIYSNIAVHEL
ncbi:hypothetical protein FQA47_006350 [Oryzias melastigma]|uniref:Immunoglobulin domain-containing protein n=1 Tax=Oryzias melastigma TaxID=30732 RepID=A0A834C6K5_ORYME|nr:hypothetical protein FQA47_006350 [Oryzias melastigma]